LIFTVEEKYRVTCYDFLLLLFGIKVLNQIIKKKNIIKDVFEWKKTNYTQGVYDKK